MKRTYILSLFVGIGVLIATPFVLSAQTTSFDAEIARLLAQLQTLQAQYYQLTGVYVPVSVPTTTTPTASNRCVSIMGTLGQGSENAEVRSLQVFLSETGLYAGPITGYFGVLTQSAVQTFQTMHGIVSSGAPSTTGYGAVGSRTRAKIYEVSCARGVSVPVVPTVPFVPVVPPVVTPPITQPVYQSCTLGGISIAHGYSRTFYSKSQATYNTETCGQFALTRTCNNGVLSGSSAYTYAGCVQGTAASCTLGGTTVSHGSSHTFYSKEYGAGTSGCSGASLSRECNNGTLSGSSTYSYASCTTIAEGACRIDGITLANGESKTLYSATTPASGQACSAISQTRTCTNEVLSGSSTYKYATCTDPNPGCVVDGVAVSSGSSRTFYLQKHVPSTESCSSYGISRTCTNGALTENSSYRYASCSVLPEKACLVGDTVYTHGSSTTFFNVTQAPAGTKCTDRDLARTCSNGVMSGSSSYQHTTCTDTASCTLDGVTVADGVSRTFYRAETVAYGSLCSSVGLTRKCVNGAFDGSALYVHEACRVLPPS